MFDLVSIAISRISVAVLSKKRTAVLPCSNLVLSIVDKLYKLGYVNNYKILDPKSVCVWLGYFDNQPKIRRIVRVSKPGKRVFFRSARMKRHVGNKVHGFWLVTTSRGVLTDQECFFYNIGGEVLCLVS